MKSLIFATDSDAFKVGEQLYKVTQDGSLLMVHSPDQRAIDLAIALTGVQEPIEVGACCRLPMPCIDWDDSKPAIYIACLSAYNNGRLHGAWINADRDVDEIQEDVEFILSYSPEDDAEEWAIHDYQGFEGLKIKEYEDLEKVSELAQAIAEHGKAFSLYCQHHGDETTVDKFLDRYRGCHASEEDFVEYQWEEDGTLSRLKEIGISASYINWEQVARDWFIDDYFSAEASFGEVYVFSRH
jgi:antirestriction protein